MFPAVLPMHEFAFQTIAHALHSGPARAHMRTSRDESAAVWHLSRSVRNHHRRSQRRRGIWMLEQRRGFPAISFSPPACRHSGTDIRNSPSIISALTRSAPQKSRCVRLR